MVPPDLRSHLARLRLAVVTQLGLVAERGDDYRREVDDDDVPHPYPCRSLLEAGITVMGSTDVAHATDPWAAIAAAVRRRTPSVRCSARTSEAGRRRLDLFGHDPLRPGTGRSWSCPEPPPICACWWRCSTPPCRPCPTSRWRSRSAAAGSSGPREPSPYGMTLPSFSAAIRLPVVAELQQHRCADPSPAPERPRRARPRHRRAGRLSCDHPPWAGRHRRRGDGSLVTPPKSWTDPTRRRGPRSARPTRPAVASVNSSSRMAISAPRLVMSPPKESKRASSRSSSRPTAAATCGQWRAASSPSSQNQSPSPAW